ncbi:hypothetical protein RRG08_029074 [Elysia crispata]|uniref:Uncharacterized protein n=1 Tax=Elysia crispata TaxID=231223 RepID=A0AAE1DHK3_9GAST|nr:hypothetical protein RRG08_029074 [Elysia crispata]
MVEATSSPRHTYPKTKENRIALNLWYPIISVLSVCSIAMATALQRQNRISIQETLKTASIFLLTTFERNTLSRRASSSPALTLTQLSDQPSTPELNYKVGAICYHVPSEAAVRSSNQSSLDLSPGEATLTTASGRWMAPLGRATRALWTFPLARPPSPQPRVDGWRR